MCCCVWLLCTRLVLGVLDVGLLASVHSTAATGQGEGDMSMCWRGASEALAPSGGTHLPLNAPRRTS